MIRKDGIDSIFLERELNAVLTKTYDRKYADLKGRGLVKTDRSVRPGEKTFTWLSYDRAGVVKLVAAAANDMPMSDIKSTENTGRIDYYQGGYKYDLFELLAAQVSNKPLVAKKGEAARLAHEENFDRLIAFGDVKTGTVGLLNQPNAQIYTPPNGVSTHADWARKTPDEILADLNGMVNKITSVTKGVHRAKKVLLPIDQYTLIATTARSVTSDTTILEFFQKNQPGVVIDHWYRCGGAGVSGVDRMIAYDDDEMAIAFFVAMEFQQQPVQEVGLEFRIPCVSGAGGCTAFYPLAICMADGI